MVHLWCGGLVIRQHLSITETAHEVSRLALRTAESHQQDAQFVIHISFTRHCLRNFGPEQLAVLLSQPMDSDLDGALGHGKLLSHLPQSRSAGLAGQKDFERIELSQLPGVCVVLAKLCERAIE